jgi:hypothetical protein
MSWDGFSCKGGRIICMGPEPIDYATPQPSPAPQSRSTTEPITAILGILIYGTIAFAMLIPIVILILHPRRIFNMEIGSAAVYLFVLCFCAMRIYQAVMALRYPRRLPEIRDNTDHAEKLKSLTENQ